MVRLLAAAFLLTTRLSFAQLRALDAAPGAPLSAVPASVPLAARAVFSLSPAPLLPVHPALSPLRRLPPLLTAQLARGAERAASLLDRFYSGGAGGGGLRAVEADGGGGPLARPVPRRALLRPRLPDRFLGIRPIIQKTEYSCGPAALLSILRYWLGYRGTERSLYGLLKTTEKDGTHPKDLAAGARAFGLSTSMKTGVRLSELRAALDRGDSVILDLQAWREGKDRSKPWSRVWEAGHYAVLVGLDEQNAYFMDPSADGKYAWLPLDELKERWHDYENRKGTVEVYRRLAVFINGDAAPRPAPRRPLIRMR